MTLDQFRQLAETWGGDIARWPKAMQSHARAMAATPQGAAILAEQAAFDNQLAQPLVIAPHRVADARFAVLQRITEMPARPAWYARLLQWRLAPAMGLACSVLLGVSVAVLAPYHRSPAPETVLALLLEIPDSPLWSFP